jgi:hypothetical protein
VFNQRLTLNVPAKVVTVDQSNGWMNSDIFLLWLKEPVTRNGLSCMKTFPLNRNVFNDIDFLSSQVTEIPKPSNVKSVHSEDGVTDTITPLTRGGQYTAEGLKQISALADGSEQRKPQEKGRHSYRKSIQE